MKCINEKCSGNNLKGECQSIKDFKCESRINPTHTPTYAEEQLEHAQEKEDRCYREKCSENKENKCITTNKACFSRRIEEPINYKEEYNKLKKTIEVKDKRIEWLEEEKRKLECGVETLKVRKENENLKIDNSNSYATIIELHEEIDQIMKERDNYKEIAESQNKRIEELENQLENELNRNRVLKEKLEEKPINIHNYESEINKFRCQYEEAKYYIEAKETEIKNLNKKLEESEMTVKMIKRLVEGL